MYHIIIEMKDWTLDDEIESDGPIDGLLWIIANFNIDNKTIENVRITRI